VVGKKHYFPFLLAFGSFSGFIAANAIKPDGFASFIVFSFLAAALIAVNAARTREIRASAALIVLAGACAGLCAYQARSLSEANPITLAEISKVITVDCVVSGEPQSFGSDGRRIPVRLRRVTTADGYRYSASGNASVILPEPYALGNMPGRATLAGQYAIGKGLRTEFSGRFLAERNGSGTLFIANAWDGNGTSPGADAGVRLSLRHSLIRAIMSRGATGGLLLALLSGNREYLEGGLADAFREAGLSHILALSGMHLSIIGLLVLRFGRGMAGERFSIRLSLIAIVFFVWFAGPSPSLIRAVLMAFLLFAAKSLGLTVSPLAVLAFSASVQLFLLPLDAVSPAFALSYGALAGILSLSGPLTALLPSVIPLPLRSCLSASIGAQLATVGYAAAVFGSFVPCGFLAAVAVGPLATLFLSSGIVWVALYAVSPAIGIAAFPVMEFQYRIIARIVRLFASFPSFQTKDLSGILLTVIISFASAAFILAAHHVTRKGRLPDAGFAGL